MKVKTEVDTTKGEGSTACVCESRDAAEEPAHTARRHAALKMSSTQSGCTVHATGVVKASFI